LISKAYLTANIEINTEEMREASCAPTPVGECGSPAGVDIGREDFSTNTIIKVNV
jgi:hypothetical protein